jgi:membrane dipeptidase
MFDTHHDLLAKLYISYLKNDFTYIENWIKNYRFDNVIGVIANLCFMSEEEMNSEFDPNFYRKDVSVIDMFKKSMELLREHIPSDLKVFASIEGCDFLEDENDLVALKELGLDAIVPVWNCKNKFGSGKRSEDGLTPLGERLIDKAAELNICVDLSHANDRTFWDIINYIKSKNLNVKVYASHSNSRSLCDIPRNLTDEQIKAIVELGGFVGIMSNSGFVDKGGYKKREEKLGTPEYDEYIKFLKEKYIEHILHVYKLTGSIDSICVSTDDMGFSELCNYKESTIFEYGNIANELRELLSKHFSEEDINKIMYENALNHLNQAKEKQVKRKR